MLIGVTGATGTQGGAAVEALLAHQHRVRALVRDPADPAARQMSSRGVELVEGRFEDRASLDRLASGADALFSVQRAPLDDPDSERREAKALVAAGRSAGVGHFIQSSVSNAGSFATMPGWAAGRWPRNYWQSKGDVEDIVQTAGFRHATILRPAFMMENFASPKAQGMFPDLVEGRILTAIAPDTPIALIAAADIGAAVAAAVANPERFSEPVELAGDRLSVLEIAAVLARACGRAIVVETLDPAELVARGQSPGWVATQQWMNEIGYPAQPQAMTDLGLTPTRFADWATGAAAAGLLPCSGTPARHGGVAGRHGQPVN